MFHGMAPLLRRIAFFGGAFRFQGAQIKECRVRVLIAIPIHNELKYVNPVLDKVLGYHGDVLAIDDGSTDGTADLLRERRDIQVIRHPVNRGYGQSLIDAFKHADARGYDWVITMDCDEQHEPAMIPEFIRAIESEEGDIISGSRYLAPRRDDDPPPGDRRLVNRSITAILTELFGWTLTDSFCGFKAHRVSAMRKLCLDEPGYAFPMQLWPQAYRMGLRIAEIPVRLIYNDPNRSFGGVLDETAIRLKHYLDVLARELARPLPDPAKAPSAHRTMSGCGCPQ
jgi:glycosyltransferase involved in cell wall biosynthesis